MKALAAAVALFTSSVLFASVGPAHQEPSPPTQLVVHEWGTFTSIAGVDGKAAQWAPFDVTTDLPCFVHRIKLGPKSLLSGKCRMETPVLYFYSPQPIKVNVKVDFPQGLVTEWYPRASVTPDTGGQFTPPVRAGRIVWKEVAIMPGAPEAFPTEAAPNHYYAARKTAAAPVQVGTEKEKLLFYRGVGNFEPPLAATIAADGAIDVDNPTGDAVGRIVLFENRAGSRGFRVADGHEGRSRIERPALATKSAPPHAELEAILVSHGLYRDEARAMVETWRDSWFEDGTRLLYIVPRAAVDAMLPLDIKPRPVEMARVFVGRLELITPATTAEVKRSLETRDRAGLLKYGRFLLPISQRIAADPAAGLDAKGLEQFIYGTFADLTRGPSCWIR